jgi:hypothetical protein
MKLRIYNRTGADATFRGVAIVSDSYYDVSEDSQAGWIADPSIVNLIRNNHLQVSDTINNFNAQEGIEYTRLILSYGPKTPDNRSISAVNRIPPGYTIYNTGAGDHIANKTYGNGDDLVCTVASPTKEFQLLHHFYALGGRVIWENASIEDKMAGWLFAPASTGWTQATGNFDKQVLIPGVLNKLKPVAEGAGAWSVDLTAKIGTTTILKSTPVPSTGNLGWFDYDSDTNVITPNMDQKGGYDLYDQEITLVKIANRAPGRAISGSESILESSDVVGKLIFNFWKFRFTLTPAEGNANVKTAVLITTAAKKNV